MINAPGIYPDIAEQDYHADALLAPELGRSLSVSGAKVLLRNPARFEYQRRNPSEPTPAMELGTAVHATVLGAGPVWEYVDAASWVGKVASEKRAEIRSRGRLPVLAKDFDLITAMHDAIHRHPLAAAILSEGKAEQSIYWIDEPTGITCRGRVDWLRANAIVDLKTTVDASPEGFSKACANFRYDMQASWYQDGIEALTGERLPFVFIAVEKEPPHLVAVYQLDEMALALGDQDNRDARHIYAECESSGVWPGYPEQIESLSLPRWALNNLRSPL